MGFNLPEPNTFERPPDGTYLGICYRVVDLGTQDTTYKGETKKSRVIVISWELPDERMADGRPFSVARRFTFSAAENSNLRKTLESWRGKKFTTEEIADFDLAKMLTATAMLTLATEENGDKVYQNIMAVAAPMKGTPRTKEPENESFCFAMVESMWNPKLIEKLHEKMQETIKKSPEWKALSKGVKPAPAQTDLDLDDSIPF